MPFSMLDVIGTTAATLLATSLVTFVCSSTVEETVSILWATESILSQIDWILSPATLMDSAPSATRAEPSAIEASIALIPCCSAATL